MCEVIHLAGTAREILSALAEILSPPGEILSTKWKFSLLSEQIIYRSMHAHARVYEHPPAPVSLKEPTSEINMQGFCESKHGTLVP